MQALEFAALKFDECVNHRAVGRFDDGFRRALLGGHHFDPVHNEVDARLVMHLIFVLLDARGLGNIAATLGNQRHNARVEPVDVVAHLGHRAAMFHLVN